MLSSRGGRASTVRVQQLPADSGRAVLSWDRLAQGLTLAGAPQPLPAALVCAGALRGRVWRVALRGGLCRVGRAVCCDRTGLGTPCAGERGCSQDPVCRRGGAGSLSGSPVPVPSGHYPVPRSAVLGKQQAGAVLSAGSSGGRSRAPCAC